MQMMQQPTANLSRKTQAKAGSQKQSQRFSSRSIFDGWIFQVSFRRVSGLQSRAPKP